MPRLTITAIATTCVLAASPVLAQTAPTPAPTPQPAVVAPDTGTGTKATKPAGREGCGWKAKQVMS